MHIVSEQRIKQYELLHAETRFQLREWRIFVRAARWNTPEDIKKDFKSASFLKNNRVVFNIKGNDYRLVVLCAYKEGKVFVRFVGTHAEYDKINSEEI